MLPAEVKQLAEELMNTHMPALLSEGWHFDFIKGASRAGVCKYRKKLIAVNVDYAHYAPIEDVKDTILHEIAHALTPGHHHNNVWKNMCVKVGAKPERCVDGDAGHEAIHKAALLHANYRCECPNCHKEYLRVKKPKFAMYFCSHCDVPREQRIVRWLRII